MSMLRHVHRKMHSHDLGKSDIVWQRALNVPGCIRVIQCELGVLWDRF